MITEQTGVMERLKESTTALHKAAEEHPFQQAMIRGRLSVAAYVNYLSQMLAVHGALEAAMRKHASVSAVRSVVRPHHFREHLLLEDIAILGAEPEAPLPATSEFMAEMQQAIELEPISLLGFLYVLEGSTNGSKFIAKSVKRSLKLDGGRGTAYLNPHGDKQTERWAAFKENMANSHWDEQGNMALLDAAKAMFEGVIQMSDELLDCLFVGAA